jgi:urocanate hydratase
MGPICFDFGFGPFRWVCLSGEIDDLRTTDRIAGEVLKVTYETALEEIKGQLSDNILWIQQAEQNLPIVGSKSRTLYADAQGRIKIALALNELIRSGEINGHIVLGRDHHNVSGTDSSYRETTNIYDGSPPYYT